MIDVRRDIRRKMKGLEREGVRECRQDQVATGCRPLSASEPALRTRLRMTLRPR